ncbi:MAG: endolytic transglycosylase MltG [Chitinophagaceae bacterium]|nr:endolytic transglycosylase MltG [Chitinophagaceae bacterium]
MRRNIVFGILFFLLIIIAVLGWLVFMPATKFDGKSKYLFIRTKAATYGDVLKTLKDSSYIRTPGAFDFIGKKMGLPEKIKAGRYEIKKGMSLFDIARLLRNGTQSPVNIVITKLRTKEDLAAFVGKRLECDSIDVIAFLNNKDSLRNYQLDTSTAMTGIFPDTYQFFWNSEPSNVFKKLFNAKKVYWNDERKKLAADRGLNPETAYILASIVEEETRATSEKDTMASVYLNRYRKGMRLQADPTVKFALRDFGLRRIYEKHLAVESPYNTYRNTGLPPGPICTPSAETLNAVINSPATNYIYFVAKSDFSGRHLFSETYEQHLIYRRQFQEAQDKQQQLKAAKEDTGS